MLTTRHEYGALVRTWAFAGAELVYAEPDELAGAIGPRTKAVSVSHITAPTALAVKIRDDVADVLELPADKVRIALIQKARGGITITATA